jgi:hypothetical protein
MFRPEIALRVVVSGPVRADQVTISSWECPWTPLQAVALPYAPPHPHLKKHLILPSSSIPRYASITSWFCAISMGVLGDLFPIQYNDPSRGATALMLCSTRTIVTPESLIRHDLTWLPPLRDDAREVRREQELA